MHLIKLHHHFDLSQHSFDYVEEFKPVAHAPGPRTIIQEHPYVTVYDLPHLDINVRTYRNLYFVDPELVRLCNEKMAQITALPVQARHISLFKVRNTLPPHRDQFIKSAIITAIRSHEGARLKAIVDPSLPWENNFAEYNLMDTEMAILDVSVPHSLEAPNGLESWILQVAFDETVTELMEALV